MDSEVATLERQLEELSLQLQRAREEAGFAKPALSADPAPAPAPAPAPGECHGAYAMQPSLHGDTVAFVCEGDVFVADVASSGARPPRRLTTCGGCCWPSLAPDGSAVAFSCAVLGSMQVFLMPLAGGESQQLTQLPHETFPVAWRGPERLVVRSAAPGLAGYPTSTLFLVNTHSQRCVQLKSRQGAPLGEADAYWPAKEGARALVGRRTVDAHISSWAGYAGGARGELWVADEESGACTRILQDWHIGGLCRVGDRVVFVADGKHGGAGNLFALDLAQLEHEEPVQLTQNKEFCVRNPQPCAAGAARIVYQYGADLFTLELDKPELEPRRIPVAAPSFSQAMLPRMLDDPAEYLEDLLLHPDGLYVACLVRGRLFEGPLFEGPMIPRGITDGSVRNLSVVYLRDGRLASLQLGTAPGECSLVVMALPDLEARNEVRAVPEPELAPPANARKDIVLRGVDFAALGRPVELAASAAEDLLALTTCRSQLWLIELDLDKASCKAELVDRAPFERGISDVEFSACGTLLTYTKRTTNRTSRICCLDLEPRQRQHQHQRRNSRRPQGTKLTPVALTGDGPFGARDRLPTIDVDLGYCAFLSNRSLRCSRDQVFGDICFTGADSVMLVTLSEEGGNPFLRGPRWPEGSNEDGDDGYDDGYDDEEYYEEATAGRRGRQGRRDDGASGHDKNERRQTRGGARKGKAGDDRPSGSAGGGGGGGGGGKNKNHKGHKGHKGHDTRDQHQEQGVEDEPPLHLASAASRMLRVPLHTQPGDWFKDLVALDKQRLLLVRVNHTGGQADPGETADEGDGDEDEEGGEGPRGDLVCFNVKTMTETVLRHGDVLWLEASMDRRSLLLCVGDKGECSRVLALSADFEEEEDTWAEVDEKDQDEGRPLGVKDKCVVRLGSRLALRVDPRIEWRQMLAEMWQSCLEQVQRLPEQPEVPRSMYDRYSALLPRVRSRECFADLVAQCLAVFGISHLYNALGDYEVPGRSASCAAQGWLGLQGEWDRRKNGFVLSAVHRGLPWAPLAAGPLAAAWPALQAGDKVQAVNGVALDSHRALARELEGLAGAEVMLRVKRQGLAQAEHLRVRCVDAGAQEHIQYLDALQAKATWVHEKSGGQCGYVHVPSMDSVGFAVFARQIVGEGERAGLVVDLRGNPGGDLSEQLLEKLAKSAFCVSLPRHGRPFRSPICPQRLALLVDQHSASDSEIFALAFRSLGLGPIVGAQTWGGVTGITDSVDLVDGSYIAHPTLALHADDEGFSVENKGVAPDHTVELAPFTTADTQLERALELLLASPASSSSPK